MIHVEHHKLIASRYYGRMTAKKEAGVLKLVAAKSTKPTEELAYEEYQKNIELAIEKH